MDWLADSRVSEVTAWGVRAPQGGFDELIKALSNPGSPGSTALVMGKDITGA